MKKLTKINSIGLKIVCWQCLNYSTLYSITVSKRFDKFSKNIFQNGTLKLPIYLFTEIDLYGSISYNLAIVNSIKFT